MKAIKVLYFASLRELLGKAEDIIEVDAPVEVSTIWQLLNPKTPLPDSCLIAINQEYANSDSKLKEGDELAFFPPVTGG